MKIRSGRKSVIKAISIGRSALIPGLLFAVLIACATPAPPPQATGESAVTIQEGLDHIVVEIVDLLF